MWKWIVALLVIIVIGVAVWKSGLISMGQNGAFSQTASSTPTQTSQEPQSGLPTAQSDTSDAAVAQDEAAIDAQMSGLSQDQSSINSSMNDQAGAQSF